MNLKGKTALVTGAARRVGRAIAAALAERGADIAIHYNRSREEARGLAAELESSYGCRTALFRADLSDARQVLGLAKSDLRRFKTVDVLVNSASVYRKTPFGKIRLDDWDSHLDINLKAPFLLSQALGAAMKKAGEGAIVNIADWAAIRPYADYMPYCVSKAGLLALNKALAKALAPEVRVNAVLPGPVLMPEGASRKFWEGEVRRATVLKRLGSPEDIARAVLFLVEGARFTTGAELTVDGGRLIA